MESAFEAVSPETHGISTAAIHRMLDEMDARELEVTAITLLVGGESVLQFCKRPYNLSPRHLWFSVTKAITGIGVGIACDQCLLSLDDLVVSYFPEKLPPIVSENLNKLRVRHLLSMTCGIDEKSSPLISAHDDPVRLLLTQEFVHEPGSSFVYSTHASHTLAAIVQKASGISFADFIEEYLMKPLKVRDMTWETCDFGVTAGGLGIGLSLDAMARFGYMLLHSGKYGRKQIVSRDYLELALSEHSNNRHLDRRHKNGYGFHMCLGHGGDFYHEGAFGQLCYVSPARDAVLVVASRKNNWDDVIDLFQGLFQPPDEEASAPLFPSLRNRLDEMAYPTPAFTGIPSGTPKLDGAAYGMESNPLELQSICFRQSHPPQLHLHLDYNGREPSDLLFDFEKPVAGWDYFSKDIQIHHQRYVSYASWLDNSTLSLTVLYIETPYQVTYHIAFGEGSLSFDYHINVTFGGNTCHIEGKSLAPCMPSLHS